MYDYWAEFLALLSLIISISVIIRVLHSKGKCLWMTCPCLTRIKPVQVVPIPDDGIPLATEVNLARIV